MLNKLDALHLVVPTIMACALVVSSNWRLNFLVGSYKNVSIEMRANITVSLAKLTTMRAQFTFPTLEVYHA